MLTLIQYGIMQVNHYNTVLESSRFDGTFRKSIMVIHNQFTCSKANFRIVVITLQSGYPCFTKPLAISVQSTPTRINVLIFFELDIYTGK